MHTNKGFIVPLVVIVIAAVVVGGGSYYVVKQSGKSDQKKSAEIPEQETVSGTVDASATAQTGGVNGTIRSLFSLTKDTMCTFDGTSGSGSVSGTVYISGTSMRSDVVMKASATSTEEAHMIRNGDTVFAWYGSQGVKLAFNDVMGANASAAAKTKTGFDLDQKVNYKCSDWTKDASKFTAPSSIKFIDVSAFLNTTLKAR